MGDLEKALKQPGWFDIPGLRRGSRTLKEQMTGLSYVLAEANGKTVLDLGCAEGLISVELAKAGAVVTALEQFDVHALVARKVLAEYPDIEFIQTDYQKWETQRSFDIVLALAVVHKARQVAPALDKVISLTSNPGLLVFRWPAWMRNDMVLRSKQRTGSKVDTIHTLHAAGFREERTEMGPREEMVQYWRRR